MTAKSIILFVIIWFNILMDCFSLWGTDEICLRYQRIHLNIFYVFATAWFLIPKIIKIFKVSIKSGIFIVGFIISVLALFIFFNYCLLG